MNNVILFTNRIRTIKTNNNYSGKNRYEENRESINTISTK